MNPGLGEMLGELIQWMETTVPTLLEKHSPTVVPKLDWIILDGDSGTTNEV